MAESDQDGGGEEVAPDALNSLSKFTLFETKSRFYVTASTFDTHRVLKIDRTDPTTLGVTEDQTIYDDAQLDLLLRMVQDGNKSQGGLEKVLEFHGIVGFVKFTSGWYLVLVTKRSVVGLLGGHYIYHCDETTLIAVSQKAVRSTQETKLVNTFQSVDLSKNFYFSYSYDITNTLQANLTISPDHRKWNTRFMWNHYLLAPAFDLEEPKGRSRWVLPLIHGFVDQAKIALFSRTVYLTVIARRSRHYAGARYLTRGANEQGHVANEVESEQIVSEPLGTTFGSNARAFSRKRDTDYGGYTSFVQYRGSIPVMWHQEVNQMTPRPPIEIPIKDPFYTRAARHFDDLLGRYGSPIYILNLIKSRESQPRESKLLAEYGQCISYLNQFLPEEHRMRYIAWDMSQAWKRGNDVIGAIEDVCEESIQATKFFHGGPSRSDFSENRRTEPLLQQGILRTNCVDCLDRTNAAQFAIAKRALGHQLHALGLIGSPIVPFGSDAVDVLNEMYHDHGDTIAWQYTGSALVNRVETYRRTKAGGQWSSHSRDLLENIRRFYNNSMLDADKQAAINLFLGVEHASSAIQAQAERPHYRNWFTPAHLEPRRIDEMAAINDEVYREYYKPHILSQFMRLYAFTMNSTNKLHNKSKSDLQLSPFEPKTAELAEALPPERRIARRWATSWRAPGSHVEPDQKDDDVTPAVKDKEEVHPVEALLNGLMDPSDDDVAQRAQEYERYLHYHADDLNASDALVEEKDLQLYIRAAQLARGEDVERLVQSEHERQVEYDHDTLDEGTGSNDNNAAFYESYLKPMAV